ncbi:MAG TPA: molybdopterin-dependent oxidoreductase, partial [Gemmatimonadales bacterium]|nr:molybdopterin-dependent oxidoreductase [Gemmatimonadales bacterium]
VRWSPFDQDALRLASQRVFGRNEIPDFDFAKAKYILSFGADFLDTWGATVQYQRQFAESHGFTADRGMAKHVYLAPRASLTGLNADEWHAVAPGSEATLALAMAGALFAKKGGAPAGVPAVSLEQAAEATGLKAEDIARIADEFAAAGPGLAVGGGIGVQGPWAVELASAVYMLNLAAGNVGETVLFGADVDTGDGYAAFRALQGAMDAGQVKVLLVHEANPVYATPKAGKFAEALAKVPFKVSTALVLDETAAACDLLLPNLHALERWDDANPRAGVWGLMQPVMEPVYPVRHTGDVLLATAQKAGGALAKFTAPSFEAYLKEKWAARAGGADAWLAALARGGVFQPAAT